MSLTLEQVRHVALLARLSLTPEEERRFQQQLSAILEAMKQLDELDTSKVEATSHATRGEASALRPDEERPSIGPDKAVGNAPAKVGTSFAVPRIIE